MKVKLPVSIQNWISLIGIAVALISIFMILILFILSFILGKEGIYLGLFTYILLPAVMMTGLILIPIGMFIKSMRRAKQKEVKRLEWPRIDLNLTKHRQAFFIFSIGTALVLFLSLLGSYEAFHFTESVSFCGQLCHKIMKPEYTTYKNSPHARVSCVECHVGPGAGWYVRSKLSGLYQVYATIFNKYPRPIPTPIENLRPAREVCEQCHWPEQFYAYNIRFEKYFLANEETTEWNIRLVVKTGSEHPAMELKEGIHWHINPDVKIEYLASDERREEIPWVKYTDNKTGEIIIYQSEDYEPESDQSGKSEIRTMDCIDCHNRPSHIYQTPSRFVNAAMTSGNISPSLPKIKSLAMELYSDEYASEESGLKAIEEKISEYYKEDYPEVYAEKRELITSTIIELQRLFSLNIFPEMKVRWSVHSDHIGHLNYKGCFRCHDGSLSAKNGGAIRRNCNLCHIITAQGTPPQLETGDIQKPLEFKHPVDIDEEWKETSCSECHEGTGF